MKSADGDFFIRNLKKKLKLSRMTYRELAKQLEMSEAGVKKLFSKSDISMSRAFQICALLNLNMAEVIQEANDESVAEKVFSDQQVAFFTKNPHFFFFYMRLAYEKKTLEELQEEYKLTERSIFLYLKKLDEIGLLILKSKNTFSFVDGPVLRLRTAGTKLEKIKFQATRNLLSRIETDVAGELSGGIFFLTHEQQLQLKKHSYELMDQYSKFSVENRLSRQKNKKNNFQVYTWMMMGGQYTLFDPIINIPQSAK